MNFCSMTETLCLLHCTKQFTPKLKSGLPTLPCFLRGLKAQLASQKDVSQHVHLQQIGGRPADTSQHCCTQL